MPGWLRRRIEDIRNIGTIPPSVIVFKEGDYAVAVDGETKQVIPGARSKDHAEVIQKAIYSLMIEYDTTYRLGGLLFIKKGQYAIDRPIVIPEKYNGKNVGIDGFRLLGEGCTSGFINAESFTKLYTTGAFPDGDYGVIQVEADGYGLEIGNLTVACGGKNIHGIIVKKPFTWGYLHDLVVTGPYNSYFAGKAGILLDVGGGNGFMVERAFIQFFDVGLAVGGADWLVVDAVRTYKCNYGLSLGVPDSFTYSRRSTGVSDSRFGFIQVVDPLTNAVLVKNAYGYQNKIDYIKVEMGQDIQEVIRHDSGEIDLEIDTVGISRHGHSYTALVGGDGAKNVIIRRVVDQTDGYSTRSVTGFGHEHYVTTLSGDGSTQVFKLGTIKYPVTDPSIATFKSQPLTDDAKIPYVIYLQDDDSDGIYESVYVKFSSAPPSGTDNVKTVSYTHLTLPTN